MQKMIIDTSKELLIARCGNGVKLLRPNNIDTKERLSLYNIADLLELPMNIYFLNTESIIQNINEKAVITCGFPSIKSTIGKTVHIAAKKEIANFVIKQDFEVVQKNKMIINEQHFVRSDNLDFPAIGIRYPIYENNKIIGILSIAIILNNAHASSLSQSLSLLTNTGLLGNSQHTQIVSLPGNIIDHVYLSQRESQCLYHLIRGKTAKVTAKILGLSPRTVEHYIDNIKVKLCVSSKSELIDKVISNILS